MPHLLRIAEAASGDAGALAAAVLCNLRRERSFDRAGTRGVKIDDVPSDVRTCLASAAASSSSETRTVLFVGPRAVLAVTHHQPPINLNLPHPPSVARASRP